MARFHPMLEVRIVEDDLMIADSAADIILENGYQVCGIARTVAEGVVLARLHKPDLAIVDLRLADDELGTEVAAQLTPRGKLGTLYATGNISQVVLSLVDGDDRLSKPYRAAVLLRSLEIVSEIVDTGAAFPRGLPIFHPSITETPGVIRAMPP
jgi:DNA-binding response OmpR family regulator